MMSKSARSFTTAAILLTGFFLLPANAAKLWRKVPVTEYEKLHRLHSPGISDIEVGADGVIYAITGSGLQRWDNYRWFTVDRDSEPLRWEKEKNLYIARRRTSPIGERPQGVYIRMAEPDRMIGIAERFAIDSGGRFWVTTSNGRVFSGVANKWKREPIMASEIVSGPGHQLVAWSIRPATWQRKNEHSDWMQQNPHPKWFNGTSWIDLANIPVPFKTITFDSEGHLWLLALDGSVEDRPGRIFRRIGNAWQEMPAVPDARHIETDERGTLWVISYSMSHDQTDGWTPANTRFHQWQNGEWFDDAALPDFPTPTYLSGNFHGSFIQFKGNLTFAQSNRWVSLLDVSQEEFDRVQKQRAERNRKPADEVADEFDEDDDEEANPFVSMSTSDEIPERGPDSPLFVGRWQWSNGVFVKIFADGRVDAGLFRTTWSAGDDERHFVIEWPGIRDTWTLSADGNGFTATTSLNMQQSGRRSSGDSSSAAGQWQRNDGAVLSLEEDGTVTAGPFHGTWQQTGETKVVIEWPVVDKIVVAADGNSLTAQTQFQQNTATRETK